MTSHSLFLRRGAKPFESLRPAIELSSLGGGGERGAVAKQPAQIVLPCS